MGSDRKRSRTEYWAAEEEEDTFVSECHGKIEHHRRVLTDSHYISRIRRNWRYYHGLFFDEEGSYTNSTEIKQLGEQGEHQAIATNHFRNFIQHLLTSITQDRPAVNCKAVNRDEKSLEQARLGTSVCEYQLQNQNVENYLRKAVEHGLVLGVGYVYRRWDPSKGKEYDPIGFSQDEETGENFLEYPAADADRTAAVYGMEETPDDWPDDELMTYGDLTGQDELTHSGDLAFSNPTLFDVVFDTTARDWEDVKWVLIRTRENRFDLATRYPEKEDEILNMTDDENTYDFRIGSYSRQQDTDEIDVWEFYHIRTDSLPDGRYVKIVGDLFLDGTWLPYKGLPLDRFSPNDILLSAFGYSPGFDLQGPQEGLNQTLSTVMSNIKNLAKKRIWSKTGNDVTAYDISDEFGVLECNEKPEVLDLYGGDPALYPFMEFLISSMEYTSGVNSVVRGQPDENLRAGNMLAIVDAKFKQYNSTAENSYHKLIEDVCQGILQTLRMYQHDERLIAIVGKADKAYAERYFTGDDLHLIDRVEVEAANPLSKTISGKTQLALQLMNGRYPDGRPWLQDPHEFLRVIETGRLDLMLDNEQQISSTIHAENERLLGEDPQHFPMVTDPHVLHMKEHAAQLSRPEMREDQAKAAPVQAAVQQHMEMLMNPNVQVIQSLLGYDPGPFLRPPDQPGPQGGPQKPAPQPGSGVVPVAQTNAGNVDLPDGPEEVQQRVTARDGTDVPAV